MRRTEKRDSESNKPGEAGSLRSGRLPVWLGVAMIGIGVLAYRGGLSGPFIFDDLHAIPDNPHTRQLRPLWHAMAAPAESTLAGRPVVALSFAINRAFSGLNVRGYHLVNVGIHLLSSLVLLGIVRRTLLSPVFAGRLDRAAAWLAAAVAAIWMIHPLQTEAVTYIVQRTELLMGLFYLLTLYCAIRGWGARRSWSWHVAAVGACALGMASKEAMVSAPLLVLLYDWVFCSGSPRNALRRHWGLYAGLATSWLVLAMLNIHGPRSATVGMQLGISSLDYLKTQAGVIVWYLRLSVWPDSLAISYDDWPIVRSLTHIVPQGLLITGLLVGSAWALWRGSWLGFLGAWFFLILAPTSSFVPIVTEVAADRRMYLPLAAVVVLVVIGGHSLLTYACKPLSLSSGVSSAITAVLAFGCVAALGYGTAVRNRDYRTTLTIWSDTVAKRPQNGLARCWLGKVLADQGRYDEAVQNYTEALRLKPGYVEAYSNLGVVLVKLGRIDEAIECCTKAIAIKGDFAEAYNNRGSAYNDKGDYDQAIADLTRAIEFKNDYAEALSSRGVARARKGNITGAMEDLTKAIELRGDYSEAYLNRGNVREGLADHDGAIADFSRVIELKPALAEVYGSRGSAYTGKGDFDAAIADFSKMIELRPDHFLAYGRRGLAYARKGTLDKAVADFTSAIAIKDDYVEAYNNRAIAYCTLREYDKAWADVKACTRLGKTPNPQLVRVLTEATGRSE